MVRAVTVGVLSLTMAIWAQRGSKIDTTTRENDMVWNKYPSEDPVKAFAVAGNILWYAAGDAVMALDLKKHGLEKFMKVGDLSAAGILTMAADGAGKVWMGGSEGLVVRDGKSFTTYTSENGLPDNEVTAVAASGNRVAVGTKNGAAVFQGGSWKAYTTSNGLAGNEVHAVVFDNSGRIWFGTGKGISCLDGSAWTQHNMKNGMSWNNTRALGFDSRTNTIWAAVGDNDINAYDGKKWNVYMSIQEGITSILCDTQSRIWFGYGSGLIKFNGDEWISDPKKLGIATGAISATFRDAGGNMWFGTSLGVMRLANPYPF